MKTFENKNDIVDLMTYSLLAYTDRKEGEDTDSYENRIHIGNHLGIAIHKFLYKYAREAYQEARSKKVEALFWNFDSKFKRTVIVIRERKQETNLLLDQEVLIINKGYMETVLDSCTHLY